MESVKHRLPREEKRPKSAFNLSLLRTLTNSGAWRQTRRIHFEGIRASFLFRDLVE